jgi:hypothetical protein
MGFPNGLLTLKRSVVLPGRMMLEGLKMKGASDSVSVAPFDSGTKTNSLVGQFHPFEELHSLIHIQVACAHSASCSTRCRMRKCSLNITYMNLVCNAAV